MKEPHKLNLSRNNSRPCKDCGQLIKPGRHKPNEYEHAQGCPRDRSKRRERPIEVLADGSLRDLSPTEIRNWKKRMRRQSQ